MPSTIIFVLFLNPFNSNIWVIFWNCLLQVFMGEWSDLLDSYDGNILKLELFSLGLEFVVKLTVTNKNSFNFLWISCLIFNDWQELFAFKNVFNWSVCCFEFQQFLWIEINQGFSVISSQLSSQNMEKVGSVWTGNNLNVAFCKLLFISQWKISVAVIIWHL